MMEMVLPSLLLSQAAELMKEWAAIDIADALELLSPDFKNHEVRAHAVATLQVRVARSDEVFPKSPAHRYRCL